MPVSCSGKLVVGVCVPLDGETAVGMLTLVTALSLGKVTVLTLGKAVTALKTGEISAVENDDDDDDDDSEY